MNRRQALALAVAGGLAGGIGIGVWRYRATPSIENADWLFELELPGPDGQVTRLSQHRGPLTVVNFWATWCAPCIEEMPELSSLHTEWQSGPAKFVGLAVDSPSQVRSHLEERPVSYPIAIIGAAGTELSKRLGASIDALPFTALIDSKGQVRRVKLGRIREEELRNWIKEES